MFGPSQAEFDALREVVTSQEKRIAEMEFNSISKERMNRFIDSVRMAEDALNAKKDERSFLSDLTTSYAWNTYSLPRPPVRTKTQLELRLEDVEYKAKYLIDRRASTGLYDEPSTVNARLSSLEHAAGEIAIGRLFTKDYASKILEVSASGQATGYDGVRVAGFLVETVNGGVATNTSASVLVSDLFSGWKVVPREDEGRVRAHRDSAVKRGAPVTDEKDAKPKRK